MRRGKNGMLYVTKHEYDECPDEMKGNIGSEYMEDGLVHSFLWNRTLIKDRALYIDGLTMVITD